MAITANFSTYTTHNLFDGSTWYAVYRELLHVFRHGSNDAEELLQQYPWLHEIDSTLPPLAVESRARVAFLSDGVTFVSVLEKFVLARFWRDILLEICIEEHKELVLPLLSALSDIVDGGLHRESMSWSPSTSSNDVVSYDDVVQGSHLSSDEQEKYRPFHNMLKSRCDAEAAAKYPDETFFFIQATLIKEKVHEKFPSIPRQELYVPGLLERMNTTIYNAIEWSNGQSWSDFSASSHWKQMWANIYKIGLLVGAKMPDPQIFASPTAICNALQAAVDGQGPVVNHMLALLEERHNTIHKQQQIITALQFRHLLENVAPGTLNATDRWQNFWTQAVQKAYDEAVATPPGPPPGTSASPLSSLLTKDLIKSAKRQTQTDPVRFLVEHNRFCPTARSLYGNLSGSIHQYATDQFHVDPQNFSSHDTRLMKCLMPLPANIKDGYVNWEKERKRFIVEQPQPQTQQPQHET